MESFIFGIFKIALICSLVGVVFWILISLEDMFRSRRITKEFRAENQAVARQSIKEYFDKKRK